MCPPATGGVGGTFMGSFGIGFLFEGARAGGAWGLCEARTVRREPSLCAQGR